MVRKALVVSIMSGILLMWCLHSMRTHSSQMKANKVRGSMAMTLTSPAFTQGQSIPKKYTCEGENISPALMWQNAPSETKSFTLMVEDPDAPGKVWIHWLVYNIAPTVFNFPQGVSIPTIKGADEGMTDAREARFHGPCPPQGHGKHRYFFRLYALDTLLPLGHGASKKEIVAAMEDHILAQAELMGTYERK